MDVWNGKAFRQIRQAFASGTGIPRFCVNCHFDMRRQCLPGYPGIPEPGLFERIADAISAIR